MEVTRTAGHATRARRTGSPATSGLGIETAHVWWFAFGGPDTPDNGLALCSLHHKLFDLGILGLDPGLRVMVSAMFSGRTRRSAVLATALPGRSGAHIGWPRTGWVTSG